MPSDGQLTVPAIAQKACRMSRYRLAPGLLLASLAALTTAAGAETKVLRVVPHADLTLLDPVFAPIPSSRENSV
jgi:hypothetical protein